jgi:hypothetical protein
LAWLAGGSAQPTGAQACYGSVRPKLAWLGSACGRPAWVGLPAARIKGGGAVRVCPKIAPFPLSRRRRLPTLAPPSPCLPSSPWSVEKPSVVWLHEPCHTPGRHSVAATRLTLWAGEDVVAKGRGATTADGGDVGAA